MRAFFEDTDLYTFKKVMDINFWGTVYCTKFALDSILKKRNYCRSFFRSGLSRFAGKKRIQRQ